MTAQYDYKKEWQKTKNHFLKLSKEAVTIAKKGEKEVLKFSKLGKFHLDSTSLKLKKDHLYYLIGKEYVILKKQEKSSQKLNKLMEEYENVQKEDELLKIKLKNKNNHK